MLSSTALHQRQRLENHNETEDVHMRVRSSVLGMVSEPGYVIPDIIMTIKVRLFDYLVVNMIIT